VKSEKTLVVEDQIELVEVGPAGLVIAGFVELQGAVLSLGVMTAESWAAAARAVAGIVEDDLLLEYPVSSLQC